MTIQSAKPNQDATGFLITLDSGIVVHVPDDMSSRHRRLLQEWLDAGNTLDPADPLPTPPTNDEIYDQVIQAQKVLKAVVLSINDGTFVPGAGVTGAVLKAIIKANM